MKRKTQTKRNNQSFSYGRYAAGAVFGLVDRALAKGVSCADQAAHELVGSAARRAGKSQTVLVNGSVWQIGAKRR